MNTCAECRDRPHARGLCNRHYKRSKAVCTTSTDIHERLALKRRMTESGCIEWTGTIGSAGYGQTTWKYRKYNVHRLVYELKHGSIPEGLLVCHRCDNPRCFNIEHLFLGTQSDNIRDAWRKGRGRAPWQQKRAANA